MASFCWLTHSAAFYPRLLRRVSINLWMLAALSSCFQADEAASPPERRSESLRPAALVDRVHRQEAAILRPPVTQFDATTDNSSDSTSSTAGTSARLEGGPLALRRDLTLARMELTKGVSQREPVPLHDAFAIDE